MKKTARILSALLALASAPSFAVIIGFEVTSGAGNPIVTPYVESGYSFTSSHMHLVGTPTQCLFGGCVASTTGQYLAEEAGSLGVPITATAAPFNLLSFDGAELFLSDAAALAGGFPNATVITVVGVRTDLSIVAASFTLDGSKDGAGGVADFQTFFLPSSFTSLMSATFLGTNASGTGGFGIDNIGVTAVPEPSTVVLFLLGITSLMYFRKRSMKA